MKSIVFLMVVMLTMATGFAACGGSTNSAAPSVDAGMTGDDSATPMDDASDMPEAPEADAPPLDHGKPSTTYPAFKPNMPNLDNNGGSVLSAPVIVTVTWETDPNAAQLEAFGDAIGSSNYWKAIGLEYGVGPATSGAANHVRVPVNAGSPLPASFTQAQIPAFVAANAGSGTSGWPAPTSQIIYMLYLHPGTKLLVGGGTNACQAGVGGYHTSTMVNGIDAAYAVVENCGGGGAFDRTTESASHELGEAATDPHPNVLPAYTGLDQNHVAFWLFQLFFMENGDACEFYPDSFYKEVAPLPFQVQRLWSNASANAGHAPCVPQKAGPYFNVTPTALEAVTADLSAAGIGIAATKGIRIKVGETKTFPVGFYSDGPAGPWSIRVAEAFNPMIPASTHNLSVSVDKTSGQNGEIAYVTVTVNKAGMTLGGQYNFARLNFVTVLSSLNGTTTYMPILIVN